MVYLVKASDLNDLLEGLNGMLKKAPARCDGSTEYIVASIFTGEKGGTLVGLERCSSGLCMPEVDRFGRDTGFASDGRVSVSFQGIGSGSISRAGDTLVGSVVGDDCAHYRMGQGFVPMFMDGTDIEVDGKCF